MASDPKRSQRLSQLIQHEIAKLLVNDVKDPRVGFATVTEVRAAADLTQAKIFVSIYGDEAKRHETLQGLTRARGYLRRELAQRLKLRQMPELAFELDTTLDQADRLDSVFNAIHEGKTSPDDAVGESSFVPAQTIRSDYAGAGESVADPSKVSKPRRRRGNRSR